LRVTSPRHRDEPGGCQARPRTLSAEDDGQRAAAAQLLNRSNSCIFRTEHSARTSAFNIGNIEWMKDTTNTELEIPAFSIYGEAEEKPTLRFLNVEDLASTNRVHNWHIRAHRHRDLFQLFLIETGQCEALIDDVAMRIDAPALLAIPPQVVHGFKFDPVSTGTILSISEPFRQDLLRVTGDIFVLENMREAIIRELTDKEVHATEIARIFGEIVDEMDRAQLGRTTVVAAKILEVLAVLARLNTLPFPKRVDAPAAGSSLFDSFCELVDKNFEKTWSVTDYAEALHTTERTLRRTLRRVADESPLDIIHRRKLIEAKRRLIYTKNSIGQIAYGLGFADSSHFTKFFVEHVGTSPAAFRGKERRPLAHNAELP
jgi:AraC family transcriptional activator of pobA